MVPGRNSGQTLHWACGTGHTDHVARLPVRGEGPNTLVSGPTADEETEGRRRNPAAPRSYSERLSVRWRLAHTIRQAQGGGAPLILAFG